MEPKTCNFARTPMFNLFKNYLPVMQVEGKEQNMVVV